MDSGSGLPESTGKTREAGISTGIDRRTFITASAGLAAACASAPWTPPTPVSFRTIEHQPIPLPDGVNLSARLWLPETAARVPAVLECVPYRKRDLYRFADDLWGPQLAANGIAFIRLDVRGSGESEGVITDEYSEAELGDCEEAIAWLARQDWCNGAVGMRGISWGGINALQVAARRPPALKAIMPMGTFIKKIQRQSKLSVIKPPKVGPKMGATIMVMPVSAKAVLRFSGGKASITIDICIGCKPPPAIPCSKRNTMSMGKDTDKPQANEAAVKPTIHNKK